MASAEWVVVIVLPRKDGTGEVNVTVRGMMPDGLEMRQQPADKPRVKLVEGRWFSPGQREVVVSSSIHKRFSNRQRRRHDAVRQRPVEGGGRLRCGRKRVRVGSLGRREPDGIGLDRQGAFRRRTCGRLIRAAASRCANRVSADQRLKLDGMLETDYYAKQTRSGGPIKIVGYVVGFIMGIGSIFAAMNTMYAAVAYRSREIATLRVIGFSKPSILTSFVFESLVLSLLGAVVGIVLMLPFNGMTTGTSNQFTFSEVVFALRMTPGVILAAIIFALVMGFFGGLAPAWHAARQNILTALRG